MPFVAIKIAGPHLAPTQVRRLQDGITDLMDGVLRKRPDLTAVLVEQAPLAGWAVGKQRVPVAAHLHATITAGSNSVAEKASFTAEAMHLLRDVLGDGLPVATYIVLDEVPGESWGYSGLTQTRRAAFARAA